MHHGDKRENPTWAQVSQTYVKAGRNKTAHYETNSVKNIRVLYNIQSSKLLLFFQSQPSGFYILTDWVMWSLLRRFRYNILQRVNYFQYLQPPTASSDRFSFRFVQLLVVETATVVAAAACLFVAQLLDLSTSQGLKLGCWFVGVDSCRTDRSKFTINFTILGNFFMLTVILQL